MNFDFDQLELVPVEWPKRGRKPAPIPEALKAALRESVQSDSTPRLVMPAEQETSFANLLSKAGSELNLRIERHVVRDSPQEGYITFHFRAKGKRNKEL